METLRFAQDKPDLRGVCRGLEAGGCGFWQERVARSKWATLYAPEGDLVGGDALPAGGSILLAGSPLRRGGLTM
jgi:hypothetical protein